MRTTRLLCLIVLSFSAVSCRAQGTHEDYRRAERFLPWNVNRLVVEAEVGPRWSEKTDKFWYRKAGRSGGRRPMASFDPAEMQDDTSPER